jgi:hypothetical protein
VHLVQSNNDSCLVSQWFLIRAAPLLHVAITPEPRSRRLAHLASKRCSVPKAGTRPPARRNTLEAPSIPPTPTHRAVCLVASTDIHALARPCCCALRPSAAPCIALTSHGLSTDSTRPRRRRRQSHQNPARDVFLRPASIATHECMTGLAISPAVVVACSRRRHAGVAPLKTDKTGIVQEK